jgi:hypothetical protein
MLYIGSGLMSASGAAPEPALIDPQLRVDWRSPDWHGETMGYWSSYATITPASRAAYLLLAEFSEPAPDVTVSGQPFM